MTGTASGYATAVLYGGIGAIGGTIPTRTTPLTLSGTPLVGRTLSIGYGTTSPAIASSGHSITWLAGGVEIPDQQGRTLVLTNAMIGKKITARVISYNWNCCDNQMQESLTTATAVQGTLTAPTPTISGSATVGSTLTAVPGTWGPAPVTLSYRWYRGTTAIAGATASTYQVTSTDKGKQLKVRVSGTKTNYKTAWKDSALTAIVP